MNDNVREDRTAVYEIGFLLAGLPEERVSAEAEAIKSIIAKNGGSVLAEEAPKKERLAYAMRKKLVSGSYETHEEAYFGWVKFEMPSASLEAVKKAIEAMASVLRILVITTVRENTYLGKRGPAVVAATHAQTYSRRAAPVPSAGGDALAAASQSEDKPVQHATVEEMDKSIDEMVKEV